MATRTLALQSPKVRGAFVAVRVGARRGIVPSGAVEQRQAVWQLMVQMGAAGRWDIALVGVSPVQAAVDATVDVAGEGGVVQHMSIHLSRWIEVSRGVEFWEWGREKSD